MTYLHFKLDSYQATALQEVQGEHTLEQSDKVVSIMTDLCLADGLARNDLEAAELCEDYIWTH